MKKSFIVCVDNDCGLLSITLGVPYLVLFNYVNTDHYKILDDNSQERFLPKDMFITLEEFYRIERNRKLDSILIEN